MWYIWKWQDPRLGRFVGMSSFVNSFTFFWIIGILLIEKDRQHKHIYLMNFIFIFKLEYQPINHKTDQPANGLSCII